jgi:putative DNA primase/helicase
MNIRSIAHHLNGVIIGDQVLAPGPNHSRSDRSLSVWIDPGCPDGFRVHSFAGDDWRVCRHHVRERLGLPSWRLRNSNQASPPERACLQQTITSVIDELDRTQRALALWQEGLPIIGTIAEAYLRHRGLFMSTEVEAADALRFHPACPFRLEDRVIVRLPTMLGLMRDIITDEPKAVHRTALRDDGAGKADHPSLGNAKKMFGPMKGAVLKLTGDADVIDGLGIGEGIESALTVICAGWRPVWACGSAGAIERFPVLPGVDSLTIFADADQAGMTAAAACQTRWAIAGLECRILAPPEAGADWNDVVRAA